jgi:CheY-like chemotaxis protein
MGFYTYRRVFDFAKNFINLFALPLPEGLFCARNFCRIFSFFLGCCRKGHYGNLTTENCRRKGDSVKKVMLLVSEDLCDILQNVLDESYTILPCYDPASGKELLRENPDVLIIEPALPGADGMTFLKNNADLLPPGVLVLTAFVNQPILLELTQLHVDSVLLLPFHLSALNQQLAALCAKKDPSR